MPAGRAGSGSGSSGTEPDAAGSGLDSTANSAMPPTPPLVQPQRSAAALDAEIEDAEQDSDEFGDAHSWAGGSPESSMSAYYSPRCIVIRKLVVYTAPCLLTSLVSTLGGSCESNMDAYHSPRSKQQQVRHQRCAVWVNSRMRRSWASGSPELSMGPRARASPSSIPGPCSECTTSSATWGPGMVSNTE